MPRLPTTFQGEETSTVTGIARRSADRLRVMNAIFEAAEGSGMSHVGSQQLQPHCPGPAVTVFSPAQSWPSPSHQRAWPVALLG